MLAAFDVLEALLDIKDFLAFIEVFDSFAGLVPIHYRHIDVHQNNIKTKLEVKSDEQNIYNRISTEEFITKIDWDEEEFGFISSVKQKNTNNEFLIAGQANYLEDKIVLLLDSLDLNIYEKLWNISEKNKIEFEQNRILFLQYPHRLLCHIRLIGKKLSKAGIFLVACCPFQ